VLRQLTPKDLPLNKQEFPPLWSNKLQRSEKVIKYFVLDDKCETKMARRLHLPYQSETTRRSSWRLRKDDAPRVLHTLG